MIPLVSCWTVAEDTNANNNNNMSNKGYYISHIFMSPCLRVMLVPPCCCLMGCSCECDEESDVNVECRLCLPC